MATVIYDSPGHEAAAARLLAARGSVRQAFEGLELGYTMEDAGDYLEVGRASLDLDERAYGRLVGLCMGFALTCVEQDRAER